MRSISDLSSGKRSVGSSNSTSHTKSERREVCTDCATLLTMIQSIDCRKYEKHENHVSYKIKKKNIFFWENIQFQTWSNQYQIKRQHYFSVTCCSGQLSLTGVSDIVSRHRNFMIFVNFLKLNWLDTHIPTYERQKQGNVSIS